MKSKELINFNPINFHVFVLQQFAFRLVFYFIAVILIFIATGNEFANPERGGFFIIVLGIVLLEVLILLSRPFIYVTDIVIDGDEVVLKWQKYNKLNKVSLDVEDICVEIVPFGIRNPYLKFTLKTKSQTPIILKQFQMDKWKLAEFKRIEDVFGKGA